MANATTPVIQINEGNVGIGTTSPTAKLHLYVNSTNDDTFQIFNGSVRTHLLASESSNGVIYMRSSANSNTIRINASGDSYFNGGNVAIGVTAPAQKLHVGDGGIRVEKNATGLGGFITIGNATETAGNYSAYFFGNSPSDTNYFKGGIAYETLSATFGRGDMHFLQNDSSNATNATISDSVMTILNGGNVGMGVTSPDSVLHVSSSVGNTYSATINDSGASENMVGIRNTISSNVNDMVGIYFATGATNSGTHWSGITGSRTNHGVDWGTQLNFYTHDDDVANLTEATQKMVIKGSGKVGIGTTGPNDALEVRGDISTQHRIRLNNLGTGTSTLAFVKDTTFKSWVEYDNSTGNFDVWQYTNNPLRFATNNAERVRIDSLGLVGINVTSPQTRLQTNLGITGNYLGYLNGTASTFDMSANVAVVHNSPAIGNGTGAGLVLANNDKSNGAPSPIIAFSAKSASNSYNHAYAAIYGVRTASGADTNWTKGDIVLATGAGTGPNEIMRVTSAGNVGIGEVSPSSKLVVRKDNAGGRGGEISIVNYATTTVGNEAALNFGLEGSTYHADFGNAQIKARVMAANAASDMIFSTWNGSSFGERMRIEAGGNVGIGATNPANKLHVEGDTNGAVQIEVDNQNNGNASYAGLYLNGQGNNFFIKNWGDQVPTRTNSTEFISTASGSSFIFSTVSTERMTITSSGSTVLHDGIDFNVNAPTHRGSLILAGASAPTNFGGIEFHTNSGGGAGYGTKIYSSDATLGVATRNNNSSFTTRFEISGSTGNAYFTGNVGIGETSPDQKLNVREDGGGDVFRGIEVHNNNQSDARAGICFKAYDWVQSAIWHGRTGTAAYAGALVLGTNPNTTDLTVSGVTGRMYILNNGNVGIGTELPQTKLQIGPLTGGDGTAQERLRLTGDYAGTNSGVLLRFTNQHDSGSNPNTGEYNLAGIIAYDYQSDWGGAMAFQTAPSVSAGGSLVTRMTIDQFGDVGIGTTSPDTKLHVTGNIRATGQTLYLSTSSVFNKIALNGTDMEIWSGALFPSIDITSAGLLKFGAYALSGAGTPTKLLGVDGSGNVLTTVSGGDLPGGPYLPLSGGTMTGNIHYSAANKATFGTAASPELKIYNNNGGYNFLESSVKFDFNVVELDINGVNGTTPIADLGPTDCRFAYSGAYKLYTTTTGITVANTIDFGGGNNDGIIEVSGSGDLIFKYKSSNPALTLDGGAVKTIVHNRLDALGIVSINNPSNNESILNIQDDGTNGHIAFENSSEITGIIASDTEVINFRTGDGVTMSDSPVLTLLPNRIGINTTSPNSNVALDIDGRVLIKDSTGVGDLYLGNYATANHFRFHTNNSNTYFDMNCGDIYWRQGTSTRYTFFPSTANMTINGTLTQNSDARVKENIVEISDCISKVQAMRGVYYNRTDFNTKVTKVGVIAQEVEAVLPELTLESTEDGLKSVAYAELTAVLINAIKEQQEIIENLTTRIEQLEN